MNIRQVEVFKAIMDAGSITEAAGRLHVSQPSVSKHLKLLELSLGLSLFERAGNRLIPAPEAHALYDQIGRTYQGLDHLNRFADGLKHHRHGEITVAAMPLIAQHWLPKVVSAFLTRHDTVSVSLPVRSSRWINESVASANVDFGIGLATGEESGTRQQLLLDLPLVCVLPRRHPLAALETVSLRDLDGQNLITLSNFDQWRLAVERALEDQRISPRRRVDTFTTFVACQLVLDGAGIAVVDALTALDYANEKVRIRRLEKAMSFEIFLLTSKHGKLSTLARSFADEVAARARETQADVSEHLNQLAA
ncbi:MAG: LysR substrate-binding domain-containing protein [Alphaproteobacteria bacterium]|nr:LysR substrate-binding domain-containing protein [Alphaproteobacteria bacterium]